MSNKNGSMRWFTGAVLAVALTGCGTVQGATPGQAGSASSIGSGDNHLTANANDIAVDQLNEQQRLAEQGANVAGYVVRDPENPAFGRNSIGSYTGPVRVAPALVP